MFDTHLHTTFSADAEMKIEEAIQKARQYDLGLVITDHYEFEYPEPGGLFFDPKAYFEAYSRFRSARLLLGIEVGLNLDFFQETKSLLEGHAFDFVLGSIHAVDHIAVWQPKYFEQRSKQEAYERYLIHMYHCLKQFSFIDSLAHFNFIERYAPYEDRAIAYDLFDDIFDEILRLLAERGKALEINTKIFKGNYTEDMLRIYKRFKALGGEFVTVGSDAHVASDVGKDLRLGYEISRICHLRPVYFQDRKPEYIVVKRLACG